MESCQAKIFGVSRHRLSTDGDGVTTLVTFHGCTLRCRHCLNPQSLGNGRRYKTYTPRSLYDEVKIDNLYFIATGGGVTFGGGEPAMHPGFITGFRNICGHDWRLTIETSLNVERENIEALLPVIDYWIIDIKDMDPGIYRQYTGSDNAKVLDNLRLITDAGRQSDCIIRLPHIHDYNTHTARKYSHRILSDLGYSDFDFFTYLI